MLPTHALFRKLFADCQEITDTYDYLPAKGTEYPFIHLSNTILNEKPASELMGGVIIDIHAFGINTQRKTLEEIADNIHTALVHMNEAYGYNMRMTDFNYRVLDDNTDVQPLLHYVMTATLLYTKKEM